MGAVEKDPPLDLVSASRDVLHRVGAHVISRRRHEVSGRIGLRAVPGGIAAPAFGEEPESLRIASTWLIREVGGSARLMPIQGSSLRALASFAGTDIDSDFSAGADTPPVGDPDVPLVLDHDGAAVVAGWFALGWQVLDEVVASLPSDADPATVQLWPEHFDAATTVSLGAAGRVNLGFSGGDAWESEPYAYLGPWEPARPGNAAYWNASFGAALTRSQLWEGESPATACREFLERGLRYLQEHGGARA